MPTLEEERERFLKVIKEAENVGAERSGAPEETDGLDKDLFESLEKMNDLLRDMQEHYGAMLTPVGGLLRPEPDTPVPTVREGLPPSGGACEDPDGHGDDGSESGPPAEKTDSSPETDTGVAQHDLCDKTADDTPLSGDGDIAPAKEKDSATPPPVIDEPLSLLFEDSAEQPDAEGCTAAEESGGKEEPGVPDGAEESICGPEPADADKEAVREENGIPAQIEKAEAAADKKTPSESADAGGEIRGGQETETFKKEEAEPAIEMSSVKTPAGETIIVRFEYGITFKTGNRPIVCCNTSVMPHKAHAHVTARLFEKNREEAELEDSYFEHPKAGREFYETTQKKYEAISGKIKQDIYGIPLHPEAFTTRLGDGVTVETFMLDPELGYETYLCVPGDEPKLMPHGKTTDPLSAKKMHEYLAASAQL